MKSLIEQHRQIKTWLEEVNNKIGELEEAYLEDTPLGNIVRGWEIDGKTIPLRKGIDEREKIFSNSSYQVFIESKLESENVLDKKTNNSKQGESNVSNNTQSKNSSSIKNKKLKKSHSNQ
jgi:hypothetical protein